MIKKSLVTGGIVTLLFLLYHCTNRAAPKPGTAAVYTGSEKCGSCHPKEWDLYRTSNHFHAMDTMNGESVKGDFNDSRFAYSGDTAFFYRRDEGYYVRTTDSTGAKKDFLVSYTFGWYPLQQYLVKFDDGRLQVLPFCWDTRTKEDGGQRWFHIYNKERISHTDELFWMGINQNWNYMCADCHTTGFSKNFDLANDRFNSSWRESRVSCESCHGPASAHLDWAEKKKGDPLFKGFPISLRAKAMEWRIDPVKRIKMPVTVIPNDTLIETCARCHARATRFSDTYQHGQSLLQTHVPATVNPVNYFVDGQIREEDYEYGSFLQSKMHASGVTCINCHEPHSMKLLTTGNALCTSCHATAKYDGPQHSFHKSESKGNQCVSCHMPVTTYMVVDDRHDHSLRVPRPDHSVEMGSPNACNKCHTDKPVKWAADQFAKWFGPKLPKEKSYAELMFAVSRYIRESEPSLFALLENKNYPAIIRATALEQYAYHTTTRVNGVILDELKSPDPFMRLNALKALGNYSSETILGHAGPLLFDKVAMVRMEAMNTLAPMQTRLTSDQSKQFNAVMTDYLKLQEQMSHRPEGFFNRAILKVFSGNSAEAEQLYLTCITRFPKFIPSYSNLVDLYREKGREDDAKRILDRGLVQNPGSSYLHYALGLWYIRSKEKERGLVELRKAALADPSNPQMSYGYAVALYSTGKPGEALALLEKRLEQYGNRPLILDGLISISQDMGQTDKASGYMAIKKEVFGY